MSKIPTELARHALSGQTMGTRWSALFYAPATVEAEPIRAALAESVDLVDRQMSTWKPDSDLMRLNRSAVGTSVAVPAALMEVLVKGLEVGRLSDGAFDIGIGDVTAAWGFGSQEADAQAIRSTLGKVRPPAHEVLELDPETLQACKLAPLTLDLSGIAKGYAVDRMMAVLEGFEIADALVGLDGELRGCGVRPDGQPWTLAIERPDYVTRAPLSMIELADAAIATSGDYRHWVEAGGKRFSHTMDRVHGGPLEESPASVTILAKTCMEADAWATAFMVAGQEASMEWTKSMGLNAIFVHRDRSEFRQAYIRGADETHTDSGIAAQFNRF